MKWLIVIVVILLAIALVVFLIIRNQKDEQELEQKLNRDYPKYKEENNKEDEANSDET